MLNLISISSCAVTADLQTLWPFGVLSPIRAWQNGSGTSFKIYFGKEHVNVRTVTHPYNPRLTHPLHSRALSTVLHFMHRSLSIPVSLRTVLGCRYHGGGACEARTPCLNALENIVAEESLTSTSLKCQKCSGKGSNCGARG